MKKSVWLLVALFMLNGCQPSKGSGSGGSGGGGGVVIPTGLVNKFKFVLNPSTSGSDAAKVLEGFDPAQDTIITINDKGIAVYKSDGNTNEITWTYNKSVKEGAGDIHIFSVKAVKVSDNTPVTAIDGKFFVCALTASDDMKRASTTATILTDTLANAEAVKFTTLSEEAYTKETVTP